MRSVEEQLQLMLTSVTALEPLEVPLQDALGTVLAADVCADHPIPAFDTAVVDGFAVRTPALVAASPSLPVWLIVDGSAEDADGDLEPRGAFAVKITAGSVVPAGYDAVLAAVSVAPVANEDARDSLAVCEPAEPGQGIRRAGSDVPEGGLVIPAGTQIGEREFAGAVSAGRARLRICPRPRVVIVTCGDELVEAGRTLEPGQMHDVNAATLVAAATSAGAVAFRTGPFSSDPEALTRAVHDQLVRADLVVVTGSADFGDAQVDGSFAASFDPLGTMDFTRTAVAPGPVIGFGTMGGQGVCVITIPGEPIAALIAFEVFVRPMIRRLAGHADLFRPVVRATLTRDINAPSGIRQFVPGGLALRGTQVIIEPLAPAMSDSPVWLGTVNAIAIVPEAVTQLLSGDRVAVIRLDRD